MSSIDHKQSLENSISADASIGAQDEVQIILNACEKKELRGIDDIEKQLLVLNQDQAAHKA